MVSSRHFTFSRPPPHFRGKKKGFDIGFSILSYARRSDGGADDEDEDDGDGLDGPRAFVGNIPF